jgi:N-acyl-D-aspartate/D-glutamate deacylase
MPVTRLFTALAAAGGLAAAALSASAAASAQTAPFDVVIRGGRVMDPETGRDETADVGITRGSIARISKTRLDGVRVIEAGGLVVAPGFVDLHSHAQDPEGYRLKALDGVTTVLEMEIGVPDFGRFLEERVHGRLLHFGATASHAAARVAALGTPQPEGTLVPPSGPGTDRAATEPEVAGITERLRAELEKGALGIGMGIAYTPGATRREVIETFRLAASLRRPVFTHVRSSGREEPGSSIESISEVIGAAAVTGASLTIVHVNSSCLREAPECLALIEGARARGLDVGVEAYPYGAGMTALNSSMFRPGWERRLGIGYESLQVPETGQTLDAESFRRLREAPEQKLVLLFLNPDDVVDAVMLHPLVMVASDGLLSHPRGAGTFARVLSRYVRAQGRLTLMDALRKMSLMPAQRLERATPAARRKGRLQEGADADIVVFDPRTVEDRATYQSPRRPSVGIQHVLVSGQPVVAGGVIVEGARPGRALLGGEGRPTAP